MRVAVVGSGIAGILSAIVAKEDGHDVVILERECEPGGLLRSVSVDGLAFDLGTHIPRQTGEVAIDELLFNRMGSEPWGRLAEVKAGTVQAGKVWGEAEYPTVQALGVAKAERSWDELKLCQPSTKVAYSLEEQLSGTFGKTITKELFGPALEKFLGVTIDVLAPDSHRLFAGRVIAGDAHSTRELKALGPWWDDRLAFHNRRQGASPLISWYSQQGGAQRWVTDICEEHLSNVRWLLGHDVETVVISDHELTLGTSSGGRIAADILVWSVGIHPFLRAAGKPQIRRPTPLVRRTHLVHIISSEPPQTDLHYLTVFDPSIAAFRFTFYSNLVPKPARLDRHGITVEYMSDSQNPDPSGAVAVRELNEIGLLDSSSKITIAKVQTIANGFPVPTLSMTALRDDLLDEAREFHQVAFVGRGAGRRFFTADVLKEIPMLIRSVVRHQR